MGCYRIWGKTDRKRHKKNIEETKDSIENELGGQGQDKSRVLTMLANCKKRWKK